LTSIKADSKAELRREALLRRSALPDETRLALSRRLADEGLRLARFWRPAVVSAFSSLPGEPDTAELMARLANAGMITALPQVVGKGSPLVFRRWRPGDATSAGPMSIREPVAAAPVVEPDLLFVPLAAFDREGHRIGYGAGFYDRTLARLRGLKSVRAVGVAFGVCEVRAVPYEAHDETLDAIVTERETIVFSAR
jgi:5-formyltetrahydrofolate cyclo-ligase